MKFEEAIKEKRPKSKVSIMFPFLLFLFKYKNKFPIFLN